MAVEYDEFGNPIPADLPEYDERGNIISDAPRKSTPLGTARALGSGAREGFIGLPGIPRDLGNLVSDTVQRFTGGKLEPINPMVANAIPFGLGNAYNAMRMGPTAADLNAGYEQITGAKPYQPQGNVEQIAKTIGVYTPAAIGGAGPVSMAARVGTTAAGGEAGKFAGRALSGGDPLAEQWGGVLGAAAGLSAAGPLERASKPREMMEGPIPDSVYLKPGPGGIGAAGVEAPPQIPVPKPRAMGRVEQVLRRGGVKTSKDLQARAAAYQDAGVTPVLGQLAGEPGLIETKALVSAPGKTVQRARNVLNEQKPKVQEAALEAVNKSFGKRTEYDAIRAADNAFEAYQKDYNAILDRATPEPAGVQVLDAMWENGTGPAVKKIFERDIAEKLPAEGLTVETAPVGRIWQMKKEALDTAIAQAQTAQNAGLVRSLTRFKNDVLLPAMDQAFAGYGQVRAKWAAQEANLKALQQGKTWLDSGKTAETVPQIRTALKRMTPEQRGHARIGMRSELQRLIENQPADHATLSRILENGISRQKIKAVLGEAEGQRIIMRLNMLREHAGEMTYFTPRAGSPTAPIMAQFADMMAQGMDMSQGGPLTMAKRGIDIARDPAKYMQNFEGVRNVHGRQMLTLATPETIRDVGMRLDQAQAARAAAARARAQGGLFGSQFSSRREQ